jgi:hypothetical protein
MAQGTSNPNRLYASDGVSIRATSGLHGTAPISWYPLVAPVTLNEDDLLVGSIAVSSANADHVYLTLLNYSEGNKVFYSANGGSSWSNISFDLPNVPVHSSVYDPTYAGVYAGTDLGVFYWNPGETNWHYFSNGLPATQVRDLHLEDGYLFAATYGRNIWRSQPYSTCPGSLVLTPQNDPAGPLSVGTWHYNANATITTTRVIGGGVATDIVNTAGTSVTLKPGFEVHPWAQFEAKIGDCPQ